MGRCLDRYRPAHSAHGTAYWLLLMWPFLMGRVLYRLRRGGKRSLRRQPRRGERPAVTATAGRPRAGPPPPPPPPAAVLWNLQEGAVRPQWNPSFEAHADRSPVRAGFGNARSQRGSPA